MKMVTWNVPEREVREEIRELDGIGPRQGNVDRRGEQGQEAEGLKT